MTRDDVVAQFGAEVLARHNFFARTATQPKEVGVWTEAGEWTVYMTNERGVEVGRLRFEDEEAALEEFTGLLRAFAFTGRDRAY